MVEVVRHDILIVGGGAAGLRAAIAAVEAEPEASVALISKVYPMRSHTVSAEGGAAAVARDDDNLEKHAYDTVKGSDFLADQHVIEYFVEEAPRELVRLEHWGCPWSRDEDGRVSVRAFGGMATNRTWYATDKVGFHMLHTLFQHSMRFDRIVRYDELFVTKLLVQAGAVRGVAALEIRTGKVIVFSGRAVVLTTGGGGCAFPFTTNGNIKTGDGMVLAYQSGVALKDMEFVQYHPTGLPGTGILITEAARGEGGHLKNKDGERFLVERDYGVGQKAELGPRDMISRAIVQEFEAGRGVPGPYGEVVHLDLRHLGEAHIEAKLPFVRELGRAYVGVDAVHELLPVRPVVHYMMGGIDVDIDGAADGLPGLFAAGETACVSLNGANRLGSNSLTECLVFGARAGRKAVEHARDADGGDEVALRREGEGEAARIEGLRGRRGSESLAGIRRELNAALEAGCGVYREEAPARGACEKIAQLKRRFADVGLRDRSRIFNTELVALLELGNMLEMGEAVAHAALYRKESRGAHARRDHPKRDDDGFLHHTLCHHDPAGPRVGQKPVRMTRWQPEERKY